MAGRVCLKTSAIDAISIIYGSIYFVLHRHISKIEKWQKVKR
jgi:hypothetical protein